MKRLKIMALALFVTTATFAQQALWGGSQIVSPEIHDNHTVTFRLRAPKAVKVEVTGDFLAPQKMEPSSKRAKGVSGSIPLLNHWHLNSTTIHLSWMVSA